MKKFSFAAVLAAIFALLAFAPSATHNTVSAQTAAATMSATKSSTMTATMAGTMAGTKAAQDRAGWPETFIIGVYPGDNIEKAIAAAEPLRTYLEKKLGAHVPSSSLARAITP